MPSWQSSTRVEEKEHTSKYSTSMPRMCSKTLANKHMTNVYDCQKWTNK